MTNKEQGSNRLLNSDQDSIKQLICPKCKQSTGVRIVNTQTVMLPNERIESASYVCLECNREWTKERKRKHGKA